MLKYCAWFIGMSFCQLVQGQTPATQRGIVLDSIKTILRSTYVFPAVSEKMIQVLQENARKGKYDTIALNANLASALTKDLQAVSSDLHLKITYDAPMVKDTTAGPPKPRMTRKEWMAALLKENNYGIKEKKVLDGNLGYLNVVLFGPLEHCADSIAAAMDLIRNTDALIIDLRSCRGSLDENTIPFFCGYFFKEPVHLSDLYDRTTDFTRQFWSYAWVPGQKYLNKPVYLLISSFTFSGGEAFAYDMKHAQRAIVWGEPSRGGAHPTELKSLVNGFRINIPYARAINPITKSNWEGTGVRPDSLVPANKSLPLVQEAILKSLLLTVNDAEKKEEISRALQALQHRKQE